MNTTLLSVIVPVYKVEDYLEDCVNSILLQTFEDFELILVDDGSPDKCPQMCDDFAKTDSRIKVIHQQNAGLSAARNAGMDIAKGKYITFVDSDDTIEYATYEPNIYYLETHPNVPLIQFPLMMVYETEQKFFQCISDGFVISDQDHLIASWVMNSPLNNSVCCKIFTKDSIGNCRFHIGKKFEDKFFMADYLPTIKSCYISSQGQYNYYQRTDSILHSSSQDTIIDYFEEECNTLKLMKTFDVPPGLLYNRFELLVINFCKIKKCSPQLINKYHYKLLQQTKPPVCKLTRCLSFLQLINKIPLYYIGGIKTMCWIYTKTKSELSYSHQTDSWPVAW